MNFLKRNLGRVAYHVALIACLTMVVANGQVWQWSQTPSSNGNIDPQINWVEGMPPSSVNDSARSMMARLAQFRDDTGGKIVATGSAFAYAGSSSSGSTNPPQDGQEVTIIAPVTNGSGVTFSLDGGTAFPIQGPAGTGIPASVMQGSVPYALTYHASTSSWLLKSYFGTASSGPAGQITVQFFNANGTYTPTTGTQYAIVYVVGGGGGGGGAAATATGTSSGGGGGGGGGAMQVLAAASIGVSQSVTIGAGGLGGAAGNNNGQNGGTTSLGSLVAASGGIGGGGAATTVAGTAGNAGSGTTGRVLVAGGLGGVGLFGTSGNIGGPSGPGGAGAWFGSTTPGVVGSPLVGTSAVNIGSGGSGGQSHNSASTAAGGNGSAGFILIYEFIL